MVPGWLVCSLILLSSWRARGSVVLQPNGISARYPTEAAYLTDLTTIQDNISPPSPPQAPSSDVNSTNLDPTMSYTPAQISRILVLPSGLISRPKPLSSIGTGCPSTRSAKLYGAKGDGVADDSAALLATAVAQRYVYLPPGTYRVAKSITLSRSILAGANTRISVDPQVTLTIVGQPYHPPTQGDPLFIGSGTVTFNSNVEVHPDWFKQSTDVDWQALQKAGDSCGKLCTVLLTRIYYLSRQWYVNPLNGVFGTSASMIVSLNNYGKGVMFRPGTYSRPFVVPSVRLFTDFCIKVQGGTVNVNIQVGTLSYCNEGVSFDTTTASTKSIRAAKVAHVSAAQSNQYTVTFRSGATTDLFSGVDVRMNFVLTSGLMAPTSASALATFFGKSPTLSGTVITVQAYDPAQYLSSTMAVGLDSSTTTPVSGVRFSVDTWLGGLVAPGKMITGSWSNLNSMLSVAGGMTPSCYFDMQATPNSFVTLGAVGTAGVQTKALTSRQSLSSFNSGNPLTDSLAFLIAPVTSDWKPYSTRVFYFYSEFAATGIANGEMSCVFARWYNPGVVCKSFTNLNSSTSKLMSVTLYNATPNTLYASSGLSIYVGIQVGP